MSIQNNYPKYIKGEFMRSYRPRRPQGRVMSGNEKSFLSGVAVDPFPRIILENGSTEPSMRALDLICPIGRGQRGLIVSSPGLGKTTLIKHISQAVLKGYPEMKVFCVLIDERPEEVTDFKRSVDAQVFCSSIDQSYDHHIQTANSVMIEAFKEAAAGNDVMILLDSLTRLSRVHNSQRRGGGRTLSGGVDAGALEVPRRIFGAARNVEGLGSISILATILVDTGSRMDDVIFEEFKGTGNMEVVLSKNIASQRIYPAIDLSKSNTRRAELLFDSEDYRRLEILRRGLATQTEVTAMEKLIKLFGQYSTNNELLESLKDLK